MFNLYKSNKTENLMDAMADILKAPLASPMTPEWIGIHSKGMRQWISVQIAEKLGISANIEFLFPRQIIERIFHHYKPFSDRPESLDESAMVWVIMKYMYTSGILSTAGPLQKYVRSDMTGKKRYQLCLKLAGLFNAYQIYRPDMLVKWQDKNHASEIKNTNEKWQASLWRRIARDKTGRDFADKATLFLSEFSPENFHMIDLPERVFLFGISGLPPLYLQIFETVSNIMDIHLFLLSPSEQYFLDMASDKYMDRLAVKHSDPMALDALYYEHTNSLLASLGTSGKCFQILLESLNYHEPLESLFQDPGQSSGTLLSWIQSDIFNLVRRGNSKREMHSEAPVPISPDDQSLMIHACHSPMRETQVVKDLLLREFESDPELSPHDVLVMLPDIEAYAPYIESVFSMENSMPFAISDRKKRSESETVEAFVKILSLKASRMEKIRVLDLLQSASIARKFSLGFDEINMISTLVEESKILWGKDKDHRKQLGLAAFKENTWKFGLNRQFMGMAMPENCRTSIQDILPCQTFEGLELAVLGKFASFLHHLFDSLEMLRREKTVSEWIKTLHDILNRMIERHSDNLSEVLFLTQSLDKLKTDASFSEFSISVSFELILPALEQILNEPLSQGSFISGHVTFCNIMPMRSIPFKTIVLMGMDESSFPRKGFHLGFDLMKNHPAMGDKNQRDENRYLFLETLLSARKNLIITYTGMSIQDNTPIPCSTVVSELMDEIDQGFLAPDQFSVHITHFLHPFDKSYFCKKTPSYFSYSRDNLFLAEKMMNSEPDEKPFISRALPSEDESKGTITLDELTAFFLNPMKAFTRNRLNVCFSEFIEETREREPFSLAGLDQYKLGRYLVENQIDNTLKTSIYSYFKDLGILPLGEKGKLEFERIFQSAIPLIDALKMRDAETMFPVVSMSAQFKKITLYTELDNISESGMVNISFGQLNSRRLLTFWLKHLALNCLDLNPGQNLQTKQTLLICRDPLKRNKTVTGVFDPIEKEKAKMYLDQMFDLYFKGLPKPLFFSCEAGYRLAKALSKNKFKLGKEAVSNAMNSSKSSWYGGKYSAGEITDRYIGLCTKNNDPFESVEKIISTGFAENAVAIFGPIIHHLRQIK